MKTRIITAIIALAVFAAVLLAPPVVFIVALAAVTFMMLYESYKATGADLAMKIVGFISAGLIIGSVCLTVFETRLMSVMPRIEWILVYVAAIIVLLLYMSLVVGEHGKKNYKDVLASGFITLYITVSMWCVCLVKEFLGIELMLLIFICAWSCDTFAYFSGRLLGKHKLIPHVSPNKTVEGAIGGVIGAIVCCLIYLLILCKLSNVGYIVNLSHWIVYFIAAGFVGGICSQLGDLIASSIKRDENIKDFGWIFPGHGGFMDRFDSVMFISPVISIMLLFAVVAF